MAKTSKKTAETPSIYTMVDSVTIKGFGVDLPLLSDVARNYFLQYGVRQSLQDSVAGLAKEMADDNDVSENPLSKSELAAAIAAAELAAVTDRYNSAMIGAIGNRATGPRVRGIDKVMRDLAIARVRAVATAQQKKMPTGEKLAKFVATVLAKNGDAIRAEAEAIMARDAELADETELDWDAVA